MSIEEFLNTFNDIIPYKFHLKIGGAKANAIITNKDLISYKNRKGKSYPFYRKSLLGVSTNYISLDELDVPIELTIDCSYPHVLKWEEKPKSTSKEITHFNVRILNEETTRQLGYLSLDLTPAGDIDHKFYCFYNEDRTHEIVQSIAYNYNEKTKKVTPTECLSYIFNDLEANTKEKVSFYKEDGNLKCVTISKNHELDDSMVCSDDETKEKNEFFSRYCNNAPVEKATLLVCDTTNYIINKDFTYRLERTKELQEDLTYEDDPSFNYYNYDKIREEIQYLTDPKNDIFSSFYGEYIGNTIIKSDSKLILVIETLKDDYHYFINVDITNTKAFDIDFYFERNDNYLYYQAIENADKTPMFRVKFEDGEEKLIPLGEQITDDELRNFEIFKSFCVESFDTIERKKMSTLSLDKCSKSHQSYELVKKK